MSWLSLADIGTMAGGVLHGRNCAVNGVSVDTRNLRGGELFVALRGTRFDGHDFVAAGSDRGAAAAMVERRIDAPLPQVLVSDTLAALTDLAAAWRRRCRVTCVALTGSNGKTTTKEMLVSVLRRCLRVVSTRGNLNNHIGVPLTLLTLREEHEAAVIEMGANHPGEIAHLAGMAKPGVAVVLNAGAAHLEGFGDLDGVAHAKGELFESLEAGSVGVVNADDAYCDYWRSLLEGCRVISFGIESGDADVTGDVTPGGMTMNVAGETRRLRLSLPGRHNVCNALAAAAVAYGLGVSLDDIAAGLEAVRSASGRLRVLDAPDGVRLIDDSYNANPVSFAAALATLSEFQGERWLVMGDMAELGDAAWESHADLGRLARRRRVSRLFACGELSRAAVESFGSGAGHFSSNEALSAHLKKQLSAAKGGGPVILVKGSRSARMEEIVRALRQETDREAEQC